MSKPEGFTSAGANGLTKTLTGELRPAPKLSDNLSLSNPYVIFIPVDGTSGKKAIVFDAQIIKNFVEPIPKPDGSYSDLSIEAYESSYCYLKRDSAGFVRMSVKDAINADADLAFTFTPAGHSAYA